MRTPGWAQRKGKGMKPNARKRGRETGGEREKET